jgi:Transposase DNA-binding/Transposase Tn5 dimerisation domain
LTKCYSLLEFLVSATARASDNHHQESVARPAVTVESSSMSVVTVSVAEWAQEQFGTAELGGRRRTRRLVKLATHMANHPSGSLPQQNESWSDLKAAYRLLDDEDVTFAGIATPHWRDTRQRLAGTPRVLVLGDTTELDFGIRRSIDGLGPTGNGGGRGFLLHSAVAVHPQTDQVFGLLGQEVYYRRPAPEGENTTQRLKRDRESEVWGRVLDAVGPPPEGTGYIHVLDRGADNFEVRCHALQRRGDYVIRVAQPARKVVDAEGREWPLKAFLEALPVAGVYELDVPAGPGRPARKARMAVSFGAASVKAPAQKSAYVRQQGREALAVWYVWAREIDPPDPKGALEWILETTLPVESFAAAREVSGYYEKRWLIEEWHKAIKTGGGLKEKQLKTSRRWEALTAVVSVVAMRLIQLRAESRVAPDREASGVVPDLYIICLRGAGKLGAAGPTVGEFWRGLAGLGGFLGRKRDGEPGWITIWRGWEKLVLMVRGVEAALGIPRK